MKKWSSCRIIHNHPRKNKFLVHIKILKLNCKYYDCYRKNPLLCTFSHCDRIMKLRNLFNIEHIRMNISAK